MGMTQTVTAEPINLMNIGNVFTGNIPDTRNLNNSSENRL